MDLWTLEKTGYDPDRSLSDGNRFLAANGYMGVRGTLAEAGKEACPAVDLAGPNKRTEKRPSQEGLFCMAKYCVISAYLSVTETKTCSARAVMVS